MKLINRSLDNNNLNNIQEDLLQVNLKLIVILINFVNYMNNILII